MKSQMNYNFVSYKSFQTSLTLSSNPDTYPSGAPIRDSHYANKYITSIEII